MTESDAAPSFLNSFFLFPGSNPVWIGTAIFCILAAFIAFIVFAIAREKKLETTSGGHYSSKAIFLQLSLLASIFLVLLTVSFLLMIKSIRDKEEMNHVLIAMSLQRAYLLDYIVQTPMFYSHDASFALAPDHPLDLEYGQLIDRNFNGLLAGGAILMDLNGTRIGMLERPVSGGIRKTLETARREWEDARDEAQNLQAAESSDDFYFGYQSLMMKIRTALATQDMALYQAHMYVEDMTRKQTIKQLVIFLAGLFTFLMTLVYAKYFIVASIERSRKRMDESEARYKLAISGTTTGIWDWDMPTDRVTWDGNMKNIFECRTDLDLPGNSEEFFSHVHPEDIGNLQNALQRHMEERREFSVEFRIETAAKSRKWIRIKGAAIRDGRGVPYRMAGYIDDITPQKEIEQELARHRKELERLVEEKTADIQSEQEQTQAIIDYMNDGLVSIDDEGYIQTFNKGAEKMFGYEAREVLGKKVNMLMPSPHRERHDSYLRNYRETGIENIINNKREISAIRKNGEEFPIALSVTRSVFKRTSTYIGIVQDISEQKEKERQLTEAKQKSAEQSLFLNTLLDHMPLAIFAKNVQDDYRFALINKRAEQVFSIEKDQIIGFSDYELWPKEEADFFREVDRKVMEGKALVEIDAEQVTTPTGTFTAHTLKVPIFDAEGKPSILLGMLEDVTNRIQEQEELKSAKENAERLNVQMQEYTDKLEAARMDAEDAKNKMSAILNAAADGIYGLDLNGFTTTANLAAERMLGFSLEEMKGSVQHALIHHTYPDGRPYPAEECNVYRAIHSGLTTHSEDEVFWRKDGTALPVSYSSTPIRDRHGNIQGAVVSFQDITERKEKERLLKLAKQEAEEASRAKSDFLANMSHEIRTPMNAVIGMSSLLLDTPLDEEQKEWANSIYSSGNMLLTIINNIIDISKIEAGKLVLEKTAFNLFNVLQELTVLYAYKAREKGLEMILRMEDGLPHHLIGDPVRIKQIFSNLISNALKFTDEGHILIDIGYRDMKNDGVSLRCRIEDTGIGIPKNKQKKVFEKFSQAEESTTRQYGGTGLGLTIVSELIELMGGKISVKSASGKGAAFTFDILLQKQQAEEKEPVYEMLRNVRVLVVDDYTLTREMLQTLFERAGMACDVARSAPEVLKILSDGGRYDVCLVDYSLGGMNGLELVRKINENGAFGRPAVILISGQMENRPYEELKQFGVDGYLKKPFRKDQVFDAIQVILQNRKDGIDAPLVTTHAISSGSHEHAGGPVRGDWPQYQKKARVLAVEDMKMNMILIKKVLGKFGLQIDTAENGLEALQKVQENVYDVVFLDCQMPVMDGFDATKKIREFERKEKRARVPIVALTADAMIGDREKCLSSGMDDYINKPFKEIEIADALARWVGRQAV